MQQIIRGAAAPWRWLPGDTLGRTLVLAASLAAAIYLATLGSGSYRSEVALIASTGVLLAAFAARSGRWLLALPFGLAAGGAALLVASDGRLFVPALACFWIAQALYARVFILYSEISYSPIRGYRLAAALLAVAYGIAITLMLWPSAAALRAPMLIYLVTNLIMVLAALRLCVSNISAGAIAFMVFNGLLAFDTFIDSPRWIDAAIWSMYMLAQFTIAHGLLIQPQSNEDAVRAIERTIRRRRMQRSGESTRGLNPAHVFSRDEARRAAARGEDVRHSTEARS